MPMLSRAHYLELGTPAGFEVPAAASAGSAEPPADAPPACTGSRKLAWGLAGALACAAAGAVGVALARQGVPGLRIGGWSLGGPFPVDQEVPQEVRGQLRWSSVQCLSVHGADEGSYVGVAECNDFSPHTQFLFTPGSFGTLIRVAAKPSLCVAVQEDGPIRVRKLSAKLLEGAVQRGGGYYEAFRAKEEVEKEDAARRAGGPHEAGRGKEEVEKEGAVQRGGGPHEAGRAKEEEDKEDRRLPPMLEPERRADRPSEFIGERRVVLSPCMASDRMLWSVPSGVGPIRLLSSRRTCVLGAPWHGATTTFDCDRMRSQDFFEVLPVRRVLDTPSLLCVALMRADSYEQEIMTAALDQGIKTKQDIGLFGCNAFKVYCVSQVLLGWHRTVGWLETTVFPGAAVDLAGNQGHAANVQIFINMWDTLRSSGESALHDWTLKADDDAVIFPSRLRESLLPYTEEGSEVYIKNCNAIPDNPKWPMMYGSLEVMSKAAVQRFLWSDWCRDKITWLAGEDEYIGKCMDWAGVGSVLDENIVADTYCLKSNDCSQPHPAYHAFKDVPTWLGCWFTATGTSPAA